MNKIILMGRLTKDVQLLQAKNSDKFVAKFSIAVKRKFVKEGESDVDYFNCTAFGKTAEVINQYVKKGQQILISGSVQFGKYKNKDGQDVYTTDVLVAEFDFIGSKSSAASESNRADESTNAEFAQVESAVDDDLPF